MLAIWKHGAPPFGYYYDKTKKQLLVKANHKKTLLLIFKMFQEGKSQKEIINYLNSHNEYFSQDDKKWSIHSLGYMLTPQRILFYAARTKNRKKGNWEPILSIAEADKLIKNKSLSNRSTRPRTNIFLLPGLNIAYCGYCGGSIKSAVSKRKTYSDYYYKCTNTEMYSPEACKESKLIRQDIINNLILNDISWQKHNFNKSKKFTAEFEKQNRIKIDSQIKNNDLELQDLLNKQAIISNRIERLEITNLINKNISHRSELIEKKLFTFNTSAFEFNNIKKLSATSQKEYLSKLVKRITIYKDYFEIEYNFAIAPGITKKRLEYE